MSNLARSLRKTARSLIDYPRRIGSGQAASQKSTYRLPEFEYIDAYGNTSMFALDVLRGLGDISNMKLLSMGCRMNQLADYLQIFQRVYHNTMLDTFIPLSDGSAKEKFVLLKGDFFKLPRLDVDCVISQATIQCYNWSGYGNEDFVTNKEKPYKVAGRLKDVIGSERSIPVIISVPVGHEGHFVDDNVHLSARDFQESFESAGFQLQTKFFDYVSGSLPALPEYQKPEYRRANELPAKDILDNEWKYVIGTYYFLSPDKQ